MIARQTIHLSLNDPKAGKGEGYNIADTTQPQTWSSKWPELCAYFGLEGTLPISNEGAGVAPYIRAHLDTWKQMEKKHGLRSGIADSDLAFEGFDYFLLVRFDFDRQYDMTKMYATGFMDALSEFPRWSDQPPLGGRQPDSMMYTDGKGIKREIFMPEGEAERAVELLMREDWAGLETEFEIYCQSKAFALRFFDFCIAYVHMLTRWKSISAGQKRQDADMMADHARGVERCARERDRSCQNLNTHDIHGDTAIHIATWADDNEALLETTSLAAASLNAVGSTPLQHAACLNHPQNGEYLLRIGTEIECRDNDDGSPMFEAVRHGNTAILEALLRHGARVDFTNRFGQTELHIAASWANVRAVESLMNARLEGLNTQTQDCKNRTMWEAFMARFAPPAGFASAFERLIDYVRRSYAEVENEVDEKDVLVDAVGCMIWWIALRALLLLSSDLPSRILG